MKPEAHPAAIVRNVADLRILAGEINAAYKTGQDFGRKGMACYREVGAKLLKAKEQVGHGEWGRWCEEHIKFSERSAQEYMKIAANWDKLKSADIADLTSALKLLAGNKVTQKPISDEVAAGRKVEAIASFFETMAASRGKGLWYPQIKPILDELRRTWGSVVGSVKEARVELPKSLNTQEFRSEWEDWLEYHRQRQSRLPPIVIKKQLAMLAEWGPERAINALEYSIRQNYRGIVEPGTNSRREDLHAGGLAFAMKGKQ